MSEYSEYVDYYRGKPLESYSKEELIQFLVQENKARIEDMNEKSRQFAILLGHSE